MYKCTLQEVGNSVALPLFSEALELEIVVMVSLGNITSDGGLDSVEHPVTESHRFHPRHIHGQVPREQEQFLSWFCIHTSLRGDCKCRRLQ